MIKAILEVCRAASAFERAKQGLTLRNDGPGEEHGISLVHPGQAALLLVENARSELLAKLLELPNPDRHRAKPPPLGAQSSGRSV